MTEPWIRDPTAAADRHWATRQGCKSVLVMVPHLVAGARLLDLLPLLEDDHRVQVVFTQPEPWENWQATGDFLAQHGGVVLPWSQARRGEYDLVLAGSLRGIDEVSGPVLLIPHGGGFAQYRRWRPRETGESWAPVLNLDSTQLIRDGRVRAAAIVLTHDDELAVLEQVCPQAVPYAVVAGDIAFDRLTTSRPHRDDYRAALGVSARQGLVVISSTWGPASAFGRHPGLFDRVLAGLPPDRYRVVGLLHPNIWSHHGAWQIRAWLARCLRSGLGLVPPDAGWRAALVAADHLIGDYGSVTTYAAGLGVGVLMSAGPDGPLRSGSPAAVVAESVPWWQPERPLVEQFVVDAGLGERVCGLLTSRPRQTGGILRQTMYRLLELTEPAGEVTLRPDPAPTLITA
ncbi:hypothetical protein [Actinokineospora inagensis]|uniref:hypothetical protein n=1 Tax=Actinokineospora inagensis TaxID=103730 RepID=UPI00047A8A9A|nr:hypothetical protein [Actinokineospora inagensis]